METDSDFFHKLVDDDDPTPLPANDQLGPPHTAVKQVQWASFGDYDDGPDPFADLAADDGFLGNTPGLHTSAASSDHAALPAEVTDQDFFAGSPGRNATDGQPECSSSGAADSTDLNYFETMYPGWKFDQATQQWYQVDTLGNAQQQQPHDASYLHSAALQTIAEEETTTAMVSSWPSEYPSNMLFYAEYPGWYFDTNTQQWHSLESYQQAAIQPGTASAVQNGTNHTPSATLDSQVAQHNSFMNSYTHRSQRQADAFANTMQPETVPDGSLTNSFYGFDQQPNAQSISSSTGHQVGFNIVEDHYKGLESSSLQSGYNSTDTQQSSYSTFKPSNAFQAGYKGFEPATGRQTSHKVFEQSSSNQGGFKAFQPPLGNQSKAFEPSTVRDAGYKGFVPSTGSQAGYKGSETSTVQQAAYNAFETSSVQQAGYMPSQPSSDQLSSYTGFETSADHGYAGANGVVNAQGFISKESMYHGPKQANAYQQGHLSNSYLGTKNSINFTQQQFLGANASHMQFAHSSQEGRSSAGRPLHTLVSFGFGGKLIVMKENSSMATNFNSGNQVSQ
jgi:COPII coat assembly protein SEC16